MRVGLVSLDQRWHDKDANFVRCTALAHGAAAQGCELVVFPEMTLTGYSTEVDVIAEPQAESSTIARFGALARDAGITIVFGACLVDPTTRRPRNELCVARPTGTSENVYAKIHPFSYAREDEVIEAGSRLAAIGVGELTVGASICYDLRFPALYAALVPQCNAAVVIASWPARRVAHWRALLVARAIENQSYMLGVNRIGTDGNGHEYVKCSMVVSHDGSLLEPLVAGEELDVYVLEPGATERYRATFPTLRDKRTELYASFGPVHAH